MREGAERAEMEMGRLERVRSWRGLGVRVMRRVVEKALWKLEDREGGERRDKEDGIFGGRRVFWI